MINSDFFLFFEVFFRGKHFIYMYIYVCVCVCVYVCVCVRERERANTLGKDMNPATLLPAIGKQYIRLGSLTLV